MTLVYTLQQLILYPRTSLVNYQGMTLQMLWYPEKDAVRLYGLNEHDFDVSVPDHEVEFIKYKITLLCGGGTNRYHEFKHKFEHQVILDQGMLRNIDGSVTMCEQSLPLDELFGFPRSYRHGWQFSD